MASMFMVKNTILRVTKAGFTPQLPSFYPPKVTRVCFTSSSKHLNNQYAREDSGGDKDGKAAERLREARQVYENDREAEKVEKDYQDMKNKAQDTAQNMKNKAQDTAHTMKNKAQDTTQTMKSKAQEGAQQASEAMQEAKENVKQNADMAKKKTGETVHETKEWAKDTAEWTGDKTKEGAGKAAEVIHNVGEKAKETAKGAWETAKGATQKIKETVVGKDDGDTRVADEYIDDRLPPKCPGDAQDQRLHRDSRSP